MFDTGRSVGFYFPFCVFRCDAVQDAAVIGVSYQEWQQKVVALVVPTASDRFDREAVLEHCSALLAPYKVPKQLEVVSELPKTASGKLRRGDLEGLFTRSDQDA